MQVMTRDNTRWEEFCDRLAGPEGCNPRKDSTGKDTWTCSGDDHFGSARAILTRMGFSAEQVAASLTYFESQGGFCDCEILFNMAA